MNKRLVITEGEETVSFKLVAEDGTETHIINANHDDHGWQAMQDIGTSLETLATALGVEIDHRSIYDETDPDPLGD